MVTKEHGVIIKTPNEGRQAKPSPTVLALLTIPLEAGVERYIHEQKLERYRRLIAESHLALTRHRIRHNELLRQLLDEEAKDRIEPPSYVKKGRPLRGPSMQ
jgi:hypothetical protein